MLKTLKDITNPIFYITNDVTKGLGLEKLLPNYFIVCIDDHPVIDCLTKVGVKVFCLERETDKKNVIFRSSGKLLEHPLVCEYIKKESDGKVPWILYFKPSAKIDLVCQKKGYKKLGNSAKLNRIFENKISFHKLCSQWGLPITPGEITNLESADFVSLQKRYQDRLVVQFGRGWAGSTTFFVEGIKEFSQLKQEVGNRKVKIGKYIEGRTILNNVCVAKNSVLVGPPAEQITAVLGFTAQKGGTCGRVWPAEIDEKQNCALRILSEKIGEKMRKRGYLGYFGLDFLIEEKIDKIYLSENNARLTASVPFYSKLEIKLRRTPLLAHHLLSFLLRATPHSGGVEKFLLNKENYSRLRSNNKLTGSEIIVRNDSKKPVLIKKDFKPGIYRVKNGELAFVREAYDIEGTNRKKEFFLIAAAKGRVVNPEIEMVRMNILENVLGANCQLEKWVVKMLLEVKESLW